MKRIHPAFLMTCFLIAAFLLMPASSYANHRAHVNVDKREAHVDLNAVETKTINLSCLAGYRVTDGSIRVDHVDQGAGNLLSVKVKESYSVTAQSYRFVVQNVATGRAQLKALVTCIRLNTHSDAHRLIGFFPRVATTHIAAGANAQRTLFCPIGYRPVAVGYRALTGFVRPTYSEPVGLRGWRMRFTAEEDSQVRMGLRCMRQRTGQASGHTHNLRLRHVVRPVVVPANSTIDAVVNCGQQEKGILASYKLGAHVKLLGHTPVPKSRIFKLQNTSHVNRIVLLDLVCVNDRTTLPL